MKIMQKKKNEAMKIEQKNDYEIFIMKMGKFPLLENLKMGLKNDYEILSTATELKNQNGDPRPRDSRN